MKPSMVTHLISADLDNIDPDLLLGNWPTTVLAQWKLDHVLQSFMLILKLLQSSSIFQENVNISVHIWIVFPSIRIQEMLFLSVSHFQVPCRHPYLQHAYAAHIAADINETNTIWFFSHVWWPLETYSDRFMQIATTWFVEKYPGWPTSLAWLYIYKLAACFLGNPLPDAKSCISEPSATWGQNGAPADVMLEELGSPSERGDQFVPVGHLVKVREISPKNAVN